MGWSVAQKTGLTFHRPQLSVKGYTLVTPLYGQACYLVDMDGRFVHEWRFDDIQVWNPKLLDNGNLMVLGLEKSLAARARTTDEGTPPFDLRIRRTGGNNSLILEPYRSRSV
jgi:hypothetical protein